VIVQNFLPKPGTDMAEHPEAGERLELQTAAVARLVLGERWNIQAPPNLNPGSLSRLLAAGVNDWGGVSPVTRWNPGPPGAQTWPIRRTDHPQAPRVTGVLIGPRASSTGASAHRLARCDGFAHPPPPPPPPYPPPPQAWARPKSRDGWRPSLPRPDTRERRGESTSCHEDTHFWRHRGDTSK
jgi:hypothetical protein